MQYRQGIETCVPIIVPKIGFLNKQPKVAAKGEVKQANRQGSAHGCYTVLILVVHGCSKGTKAKSSGQRRVNKLIDRDQPWM